jgi:hypothetical protein
LENPAVLSGIESSQGKSVAVIQLSLLLEIIRYFSRNRNIRLRYNIEQADFMNPGLAGEGKVHATPESIRNPVSFKEREGDTAALLAIHQLAIEETAFFGNADEGVAAEPVLDSSAIGIDRKIGQIPLHGNVIERYAGRRVHIQFLGGEILVAGYDGENTDWMRPGQLIPAVLTKLGRDMAVSHGDWGNLAE